MNMIRQVQMKVVRVNLDRSSARISALGSTGNFPEGKQLSIARDEK
jgi:hypothetical protein